MNMLYTTIKDTELLFGDLTPETPYSFKIRAVNKDGASAWTEFGAATKSDPLEFAIRGIRGECTAASQGRVGVKRLFDFCRVRRYLALEIRGKSRSVRTGYGPGDCQPTG